MHNACCQGLRSTKVALEGLNSRTGGKHRPLLNCFCLCSASVPRKCFYKASSSSASVPRKCLQKASIRERRPKLDDFLIVSAYFPPPFHESDSRRPQFANGGQQSATSQLFLFIFGLRSAKVLRECLNSRTQAKTR